MNEYMLWVTKKCGDGYSGRWYGWSRNLKMSYEEALIKKEQIKHLYESVDIEKVRGE